MPDISPTSRTHNLRIRRRVCPMQTNCFLFALAMLLAFALQADSLTTIQLMNRNAEEVIPIVKPMLEPGDVITGSGYKIFLRSSPQTLTLVRDMIAVLDTAARNLQISVYQGNALDLASRGVGGKLRIEGNGASVSIGTDRNNSTEGGGSIGFSAGGASGTISSKSTNKRLQNSPIHRLRVTEGRQGYIETGQQIPYFSGGGWVAPGTISGGINYKNVTTGFYVLPRIHGEMVTLQVSPFKSNRSKTGGGKIDTQRAGTIVTGRIGEWLLIGGTSEQTQRTQSGITSRASTQSRNDSSIWIRADLIE